MLRILLIGSACVLSSVLMAQNIGISNNAVAPNPAALLDLDVTSGAKRGLLIPRMTEADRLAIGAGATENALLVYQTDAGTTGDTTNARGFWYWDNPTTSWIHLGNGRQNWHITGNTLTTVTAGNAEFLGTLGPMSGYDPNPNLYFRVGTGPLTDPPAIRAGYNALDYQSGFVGLGTAAPATERLEVEGAVRVGQSDQLATPREGTIRYGTIDGSAAETWNAANSPEPNLNWHWGTVVNNGTTQWARLENAEELVTPPVLYAKDTLQCVGGTGDAFRGSLSNTPVTQTTNTPANVYSPFATNFSSAGEGNFRVQYLYRNAELVEAGLCFPAQINAFAFFCLDQENLTNTVPPGSDTGPTRITGEVRGGAPTATGLQGPGAYFGINNTPQYMDEGVRTKPLNGAFTLLTPGEGWVNFTMSTPITLNPGDNLILDIVWFRNKADGVGPRVELEEPGFTCTKWVLWPGSLGQPSNWVSLSADNGAPPGNPNPSVAVNIPININPHGKRPVTRFTGKVATPTVVQAWSNYLQYEGGVMVGDAAWAATPGNFRGPGTVKAQNGVYDGTLLLSDHVFDRYFDGHARPGEEGVAGYTYIGLNNLRERLDKERRLPSMPSRGQWEATGGTATGKLTTGLWESLEDQALYIAQLEKDLATLEEMTFGERPAPAEVERLVAEVQASKRLTEAQKMHLIGSIRAKAQTSNTNGQ